MYVWKDEAPRLGRRLNHGNPRCGVFFTLNRSLSVVHAYVGARKDCCNTIPVVDTW